MLIRSNAIRRSARGEDCTLRLPGVCNRDPETTVFAHVPRLAGSGMGTKPGDLWGVYACSACHDVIDGRARSPWGPDQLGREEGRAMIETQKRLLEKGLIAVGGGDGKR